MQALRPRRPPGCAGRCRGASRASPTPSAPRRWRRWIGVAIAACCAAFVFGQLHPDARPRRHDAGRRRHGRPRLGARLPARPPAAELPAHRLDPRLVRRLPRVPVLHGAAEPADPRCSTSCCRTASRSSSSRSSASLALPVSAYVFGRLMRLPFPGPPLLAVGDRAVPVRPRQLSRSGRSTAATSRRRSPASTRSRSACRSRCCSSACCGAASRPAAGAARATVLLALSILLPPIPAFFAVVGGVLIVLLRLDRPPRAVPRRSSCWGVS